MKPTRDKIGNIYAELEGDNKQSAPILLNAHIDTVAHDGKIKPRAKKSIITSDGRTILGADNKAGVAVIMEALKEIKEKRPRHPRLQIIFTVQEETGLVGAKALDRKMIFPKIGYVLDGGRIDTIYHKAPAQINITAEVIGRAAHAGVHPEDGINAICVASEAITKMKLGRIDFETTANIGIIRGGQATNIIPEKVFLKGEARSHDRAKLNKQIAHMRQALERACKKFKARVKITTETVYCSFSVNENDPVISVAKKVLASLGKKPRVILTGGGSDANIFNKMGIKAVIIGVGARHVHTSRERIATSDLELGVKYLLGVIARHV